MAYSVFINKCFQYAAAVTLNNEEIGRKSERSSNIMLFINKCSWGGINYSLGNNGWQTFSGI